MGQQSSAKEVDPEDVSKVIVFLKEVGASSSIPDDCCTNDSYSNILGRHIKVHKIQRGRLICHLSVKPAILVNSLSIYFKFSMSIVSQYVSLCVLDYSSFWLLWCIIFGCWTDQNYSSNQSKTECFYACLFSSELFWWNTWRGDCSFLGENGNCLCSNCCCWG